MELLTILIATVLLFAGRQMYWFFVGALGFLLGVHYAPLLLEGQPEWIILVAALVIGLVGAFLAVFLQRLALTLAGFLAGGFFCVQLAEAFAMGESFVLIAFVAGGILAAVLVLLFLDPVLIVLSALVGAAVLVQELPLDPMWRVVVFLGLVVLGIAVQATVLMRSRPAPLAT